MEFEERDEGFSSSAQDEKDTISLELWKPLSDALTVFVDSILVCLTFLQSCEAAVSVYFFDGSEDRKDPIDFWTLALAC